MKTTNLVLLAFLATSNAVKMNQTVPSKITNNNLMQLKSNQGNATDEEGPYDDSANAIAHACECGDGEFCSNHNGPNMGDCLACQTNETVETCNEEGEPSFAASCMEVCLKLPALAQLKSHHKTKQEDPLELELVKEAKVALPEEPVDEGEGGMGGPVCNCQGGNFCNNDAGLGLGACESCEDFESAEECNDSGLPEAGAAACTLACVKPPALAQLKSHHKSKQVVMTPEQQAIIDSEYAWEDEQAALANEVNAKGEPVCNCDSSSFCNNDVGPGLGFCEECSSILTAADCKNTGLQEAGVASCIKKCTGPDV